MDSLDSSTTPALILTAGDTEISKITPLNNPPFLIGRGPESSLKLRQKSVSRKQCSIDKNGRNWEIRSLGSRPLTVDGNLLFEGSSKTLKCSDIIELPGFVKFEFRCSPDQNGHCCENSVADDSVIPLNDSLDFRVPESKAPTSTPATSHNSSIDKPSADSSFILEVQSFNNDDAMDIDEISEPAAKTSLDVGFLSESNRDTNVTPKIRKELVNDDVSDYLNDESDLRKQIKSLETRIQFLQMKLNEKANVSNQLESVKKENDNLVTKNAELRRDLANKDILELEFKVLQESVRYKEEDKRSKDVLQEQIDSLQSKSVLMKIEQEKLVADLENVKNINAELMEKYKILEEKLNEKTNSTMPVDPLKDCNLDDQCCEVGAAKTNALLELMERELNCSICGEIFIEPVVTNCNHTFCMHCLREWKKMKRECPFCRTIIVQECKISFLDEMISKSLKFLSPKLLDERLQLIQERVAPPPAVQPPAPKRARVSTRAPRRTPVRSRGPQNPRNPIPIPYYVDPAVVNIP